MLLSLLLTQGDPGAPPSVSGSLVATESSANTFASTGKVLVRGGLTATETAVNTLASTGKILVKGPFTVSETGVDVFTSTGTVPAAPTVSGALSATEIGLDTFSASGKVVVKALSAALLEATPDTLNSLGKVLVKSTSITVTEGFVDTKTAIGKVLIKGPLSSLEATADGFTANGFLTSSISGVLAATESGGGVPFGGVSAVMKFWNGSSWQVLYKDPTIYT